MGGIAGPHQLNSGKADEGSLCRAKRLKLRCEKSEGITRAESAYEYKDREEIAEDLLKTVFVNQLLTNATSLPLNSSISSKHVFFRC